MPSSFHAADAERCAKRICSCAKPLLIAHRPVLRQACRRVDGIPPWMPALLLGQSSATVLPRQTGDCRSSTSLCDELLRQDIWQRAGGNVLPRCGPPPLQHARGRRGPKQDQPIRQLHSADIGDVRRALAEIVHQALPLLDCKDSAPLCC